MPLESPNYLASGTIQPCRFVKADTANPFSVLQCGATTDPILGISQEGPTDPPGVTGSATDAARAGQNITVYGIGADALLKLSGTSAYGDYLTTDASGQGVSAAPGGGRVQIGAICRQAGTVGQIVRVTVDLINIT